MSQPEGFGLLAKASGQTRGQVITVASGVVEPPVNLAGRATYFSTFTSLGTEPATFTANTIIPGIAGNLTALSIPPGCTVAIPFCTAIELATGAGIAYA